MKRAIGYIRISDKDQSNFSITGQTELITQHCQRNHYELVASFVDDGKSAKSFDRPDWKKLEAFVRKNHDQVDYLVMAKYDRFSRNTAEALQMIEVIEKKFGIRIISVMEPIHVHPESPFFFQIRTQILTNAQVEWMIIRDRTRFGIHYAAKAGRITHGAPWGYINQRDERNKPIIVVDPAKAPVIRRMYDMLLQGAPLKEISLEARRLGYANRGHSSVKYALQNPVYAGLLKVPAYNDEPESLAKGIHEPIVDVATWYRAQDILSPKAIGRTVMNEEVPLRSVLKCFCGRTMTAGNSKGRKRHYWYYKCEDHRKINLSAAKLHAQLEELLKGLSLPEAHIEYLKAQIHRQLEQQTHDREQIIQEKRRELRELQGKIDRVEEKYINDDLDKATYQKFKDRYQRELMVAQKYLVDLATPAREILELYERNLPKLQNLHHLYSTADLHGKQAMLRQVFKSNLYYEGGVYRTAYLLPMFALKAASLKENGLLVVEQPVEKVPENSGCAPDRSSLEHLSAFIHLISQIKTA